MDFDPRDYDSRDDDRLALAFNPAPEAVRMMISIATTTCGCMRRRAAVIARTEHATSVAVLATPGNRMATDTTRATTRAGRTATAIRVTRLRAI